jgi:hypothetical protein
MTIETVETIRQNVPLELRHDTAVRFILVLAALDRKDRDEIFDQEVKSRIESFRQEEQ